MILFFKRQLCNCMTMKTPITLAAAFVLGAGMLGLGCNNAEKTESETIRSSLPLDHLAAPGETLRAVTSSDTNWEMIAVVIRQGESELRIKGPNSSFVFPKAYPVSFSPSSKYALICKGHKNDILDSLAVVRLPDGSLVDGLAGDIPPCPADASVPEWAGNQATVRVQVGDEDAVFEIDAANGTSVRTH